MRPNMKNPILILAAVAAISLTGCLEKASTRASGPLFRSHFVGMAEVSRLTNTLKLNEIWSLPASKAMLNQALDKIARTPFQLWQKSLPSGSANQSALIRPLLDDLIASESYLDLRGPSADYESVVAVQLDTDR